VKRELERIEIPDEHGARERAWRVVDAAFAARDPVERAPRRLVPAIVLAVVVVAAAAAALSAPGRAVIDELREAVGIERAQPALFSLPTGGQLLVSSDAGVWVVQQDGSRRLLGEFREASWSPFGRYVAAARQNELAIREPDGDIRWTLARPNVRSPSWTGTESDTRIAYIDRSGTRVVAGDGTGDRLVARGSRGPLAWRPGDGFVLSYIDARGRIQLVDIESGTSVWPQRPLAPRFRDARKLIWSSDGRRLVLVRPSMLVVFGTENAAPLAVHRLAGIDDAAFEPGSYRLAVARDNEVVLVDAGQPAARPRRLLLGAGPFESLAWSPAGSRWLLVGWPAADQWVFVSSRGRRIRAAANLSEQFGSATFPKVEGWCCAR
jgi:hypothetical protein